MENEGLEVHDFLNDEMLEDIDADVEVMERVTEETERPLAESELDPDVLKATKLLMTPRRQASVPNTQSGIVISLIYSMTRSTVII